MTDPIRYRTGALWGVLTLLLLFGTVSAAFLVYGISDLWATGRILFDVPVIVGAGFASAILLLLVIGVLYRVDRLRGVPHREVRLFD